MTIQVALLRGINVGGHNKIKMADLRDAMNALGLARVQTYIQSGNILFESEEDEPALSGRIERAIDETFGIPLKVIIRTREQLHGILAGLPFSPDEIAEAASTGTGESLYVSMLREAPPADKLAKLEAYAVDGEKFRAAGRDVYVLYNLSIRNSKLAVQLEKLGPPITTRNWKTMSKLAELADDMANGSSAWQRPSARQRSAK